MLFVSLKMGLALEKNGDLVMAEKAFHVVILLDPSNSHALERLACILSVKAKLED